MTTTDDTRNNEPECAHSIFSWSPSSNREIALTLHKDWAMYVSPEVSVIVDPELKLIKLLPNNLT